MKKVLYTVFLAGAALFTTTGCDKNDNIGGIGNVLGTALKDIPNLKSFIVQATSAFVAGAEGLIHVFSNTLADGTYTVNYNLTGNNTFSGTSTLTMVSGVGTFSTPKLASGGPTTATVTNVTNQAGNSAAPTANNVSSMFDSSG